MDPVMAALSFYASDASGIWREDPAALGHRMLRVAPESRAEVQPHAEEGLSITADVRLDNRDELLDRFDVPTSERGSIPDCVLVLGAYELWGEDCPRHLLGDFALAVWDARRRRLFCARDAAGTRPLYYHASSERFVFASDVRGVVAHPRVPIVYDEPWVTSYLQHYQYERFESTYFAAVRKLAPGQALLWEDGALRVWRWWSPDDVEPLRLASPMEYVERLRHLVREAVAARLRSAAPVGAHMSGGLDSMPVAVLAARLGGRPMDTFTWCAPPVPGRLKKVSTLRHSIAKGFPLKHRNPSGAQIAPSVGGIVPLASAPLD
ncbi:MAG: asparagine synthetase B [Armatimonadetes bacterium]|nr:asparagine synthetase B [Armatimonadota bacterium]